MARPFKTNTTITEAQSALREHAEAYWFAGVEEGVSEENRAKAHKKYHELHDIIRELDKLRK